VIRMPMPFAARRLAWIRHAAAFPRPKCRP
jgi:hypothetical protein